MEKLICINKTEVWMYAFEVADFNTLNLRLDVSLKIKFQRKCFNQIFFDRNKSDMWHK